MHTHTHTPPPQQNMWDVPLLIHLFRLSAVVSEKYLEVFPLCVEIHQYGLFRYILAAVLIV